MSYHWYWVSGQHSDSAEGDGAGMRARDAEDTDTRPLVGGPMHAPQGVRVDILSHPHTNMPTWSQVCSCSACCTLTASCFPCACLVGSSSSAVLMSSAHTRRCLCRKADRDNASDGPHK